MNSDALVTPRSDRTFFTFNAVLSTVAVAFIAFILLRGKSAGGPDLSFMPAVNASFNALSALCLVAGYVAIRQKKIAVHRVLMVSHILLSLSVVPLALTSFYFAFKRSFVRHRRLNRVFLPIWLYVSVTGVLIFFMLR